MSNVRFSRPNSFPPVIKNLIIINILVWVAEIIYQKDNLMLHLALWPIDSPFFKPYQIATHMFAHSLLFFHVLFNMLVLFMFGRHLENVWGPKRFLFYYLACGVGAAATHLAMQYFMGTGAPAVGASGAVMGVLVGFAYLFPNTQLFIIPIPVPVKAKWAVLGFVLLDLFGGFGVYADDIAHFAHLGGALTGFLIVFIWNKTNRKSLY